MPAEEATTTGDQDAVEFMLLGAGSVQVCTAVMHYGFRIVEQLASGLENWMREKKFEKISDLMGKSAPTLNAASLNDWLEGFINITEYWDKRLKLANSGGPIGDGQPPNGDAGPPIGSSFIVRG